MWRERAVCEHKPRVDRVSDWQVFAGATAAAGRQSQNQTKSPGPRQITLSLVLLSGSIRRRAFRNFHVIYLEILANYLPDCACQKCCVVIFVLAIAYQGTGPKYLKAPERFLNPPSENVGI